MSQRGQARANGPTALGQSGPAGSNPQPGGPVCPPGRSPSTASSGYFSCDSAPSSPLMTHSDRSTQTPSLPSQLISHAQGRVSHTLQSHGMRHTPQRPYREMPDLPDALVLLEVGRDLRRIGDEFNRTYMRPRDRNVQAPLLQFWNEMAFLLHNLWGWLWNIVRPR